MAQVMYKVIQAKDFIKARPSGEVDLEQSKKILCDVAEIVLAGGEFDVLMDIRETFGNLNHAEIIELVDELGRHPNAFRHKIAVLARDDQQFNKAVFAEMMANMSMHPYKLSAFVEYEDAIEWLQSDSDIEGLWK
jgi:hypothetical protein